MTNELSFGDRLQKLEDRFHISAIQMARWLGISVSDYYGTKYKKNVRPPNNAWDKLLYMVERFGYISLFWNHFRPMTIDEVLNVHRNTQIILASDKDFWIKQSVGGGPNTVHLKWGRLIVILCEALIRWHNTGKWECDIDHYLLNELWINSAVKWQHDYDGKIEEAEYTLDESKFFFQVVRLLSTIIAEGIYFDSPKYGWLENVKAN